MLWFNLSLEERIIDCLKFQYILCYGSTCFYSIKDYDITEFQYILCYGSTTSKILSFHSTSNISIHLMLWFNLIKDFKKTNLCRFQYILCYGSTNLYIGLLSNLGIISIHLMLWFNHCWYVIAIFYYTEVLLK